MGFYVGTVLKLLAPDTGGSARHEVRSQNSDARMPLAPRGSRSLFIAGLGLKDNIHYGRWDLRNSLTMTYLDPFGDGAGLRVQGPLRKGPACFGVREAHHAEGSSSEAGQRQ